MIHWLNENVPQNEVLRFLTLFFLEKSAKYSFTPKLLDIQYIHG